MPDYDDEQALLTGTDAPLGAPVTAAADPTDEPSGAATGAPESAGDPRQAAEGEGADDSLPTGTLVAAGGLCAVAVGCVVIAVGLLQRRRS